MAENNNQKVGAIGWVDLTVDQAENVRDFYSAVTGWKSSPVAMGEYDDYNMMTPGREESVAGICHARGINVDVPAQWIIYIIVNDLDNSVAKCIEFGGSVIAGPKDLGPNARYCIIQDPAGAVAGLYQEK